MKKFLALVLALVMVFALCACGQKAAPAEEAAPAEATEEAAVEEVAIPTTTEEAKAAGRKIIIMNNHNTAESLNGQFTQVYVDYFNNNSTETWIDVYYNGELGGIQETLDGAVMGTIDIGACSPGQFASYYKDIEVWSMPYLYTDPMDGAKICDLEKNTLLADMIEATNEAAGITIVGATYSIDARQLTCQFPVYTPDDLVGHKVRCIPNPVYQCVVEGFGATPVQVDWVDTISALSNGTVEGQENPYGTLSSYKLYEVQKYVMETNHIFDLGLTYMCTDTYNALSDNDKVVMQEAIAAQQAYQNEVLSANIENYKEDLTSNGMTIITVDDGLDVAALKAGVDACKVKSFPQYADYFTWIDEYIANY